MNLTFYVSTMRIAINYEDAQTCVARLDERKQQMIF